MGAQFSFFFSLLEGLERYLALLLRRLERRVGQVQVVAVRLQAPVVEIQTTDVGTNRLLLVILF